MDQDTEDIQERLKTIDKIADNTPADEIAMRQLVKVVLLQEERIKLLEAAVKELKELAEIMLEPFNDARGKGETLDHKKGFYRPNEGVPIPRVDAVSTKTIPTPKIERDRDKAW